MKNLRLLLVPLLLLGCSQQQTDTGTPSDGLDSSASLPRPEFTFVQSSETAERERIANEAITLLTDRNYAELEALMADYRVSQDRYADGIWKLGLAYSKFELEDEAADKDWQERIELIKDWINASPQSMTPRVALARVVSGYAWKARGTAYADEVEEESWPIFFSRLRQALDVLQKAAKLTEDCPLYWSTMQRVALGLQADKAEYEDMFAQAIEAFPSYEYFYQARAYFLLPRWYGDPGEWIETLTESCDAIGGEKGDALFARVIWGLSFGSTARDVNEVLDNDPAVWERVHRGFTVIDRDYPDSSAARAGCAYLAALVGDRQVAQDRLLQLNGQVDLEQWPSEKWFHRVVDWAFPLDQ